MKLLRFRRLLSLIQKDVAPHPPWLQEALGIEPCWFGFFFRSLAFKESWQDPKARYHFGNIQFGLGPAGSGAPQYSLQHLGEREEWIFWNTSVWFMTERARHYHTHAYASLFSGKKHWLRWPQRSVHLVQVAACHIYTNSWCQVWFRFYPPPKSSLSREHARITMLRMRIAQHATRNNQ